MKGNYEDFHVLGRRKNKANSKPIQTQTNPILFSPQIFWGLKTGLKKQSQFAGGRINTRRVKTMVYGDFGDWGLRKNKANSKPIIRFWPEILNKLKGWV